MEPEAVRPGEPHPDLLNQKLGETWKNGRLLLTTLCSQARRLSLTLYPDRAWVWAFSVLLHGWVSC